MESRYTFKDFVFTILLLIVIGCVLLAMWQFNYQEARLTAVQDEVKKLGDVSRQQLAVLEGLRQDLKNAPRVALQTGPATSQTASAEATASDSSVIRRKNPDGSLYVYAPNPPRTPRDPRNLSGYVQGDWLVQSLGSEPAIVTPYIDRDAYGSAVQGPVLEALLTTDPETYERLPNLAESYTIMADGMTFQFVLRKNLVFSDGTPLTMKDVLFSYSTLRNPKIEAGPQQSYFSSVESVKALDDRTLEVKFKEPYFRALEIAGSVEIIPEHVYRFENPDDYNKRTDTLVGSGPYVFDPKNWVKGQQITLVRNDHYWGERPTFDRIVMRFIPNPQASLQALQNGQIDYMTPLPDQFVKFSKDPAFTAKFTVYKYENPMSGYMYMGYNLKNPLFKDKLTRQALTQLIDRDAINRTIGQGLYMTATGPFSTLTQQADPAIKPWPYDMEIARKKLADAGWKPNADGILERDGKPFRFTIMIPSQISLYEQLAAYIKEQFRKVGIDAIIGPLEFSVLVDRLDNRNFDACILRWGGGGAEQDPYQIWHSDSIKGRGSNYISYSNPIIDQLIENARREPDADKRMAMWRKFYAIIADDQPYTFLNSSYSTLFIDNRFENTRPYKYGVSTGDWYVPAARQKYR